MDNLEELLGRAEAALGEEDYATIKAVVESYAYIADLVGNKNITISRLQKLLFGAKTEKTAAVVGRDSNEDGKPELTSPATDAPPDSPRPSADQEAAAENDAKTPSGHGRNGADAYTGAERVEVPHESLRPGDPCPQCADGTVYESRPGVLVRLVGQAPVQAMVYYLQKLRCNLCGMLFTAQSPDDVGVNKYDATAGSMIALLKYGARNAVPSRGEVAGEPGHSLACLDPMGHRSPTGRASPAGVRRTDSAGGRRRRGSQR